MATVDERIAKLELNNQQFEQAANQTIQTLEKLDKYLELQNADAGFRNLQESANRFNLDSMTANIESISSHFTKVGMAVDKIFLDLVNKAEQTGKKIADFLAIKPVKSGFSEYETQINAIQTILANTQEKGSTLEDVNNILDDLNHYADKTIYNFTQMTKNIGTFTAAGIGLEDSATAIKGIANLAAVSGSTSEQASRAMYQLSQALASGKVNLQDWNSVVNAGMGGQIFQNALRRTAKAMGICVDESQSFRDSISASKGDSWLTSDVLLQTLKQFSGDVTEASLKAQGFTDAQIKQIIELGKTAEEAATVVKTFSQLIDTLGEALQSGWTQTWEIIVGDFDEAKELLTYISTIFGNRISDMSDARNNLLEAALGAEAAGLEQWQLVARHALDNEDLQKAIGKAAGYVDEAYAKMITQTGGFEAAMKKGMFTAKNLEEALFGSAGAVSESSESYKELEAVADRVLKGAFSTGAARVKALTDAGYDYAAVQAIVNKKLLGSETSIENLSDAQIESLGLTEEQTKAFKELIKACKESGKPLSEMYQQMTAPTGRELLIESFKNTLLALGQVMYVVKAAWQAVFPPTTADQIYSLIQKLRDFTEGLKLTGPEARSLQTVFIGLFSIVKIGVDAVKEIARGFGTLFDATKPVRDMIGDMVVSFAEYLTRINMSNTVTELFAQGVDKVVEWVLKARDAIVELYESVKEKFHWPSFGGVKEDTEDLTNGVVPEIQKASIDIISGFREVGSTIINVQNRIEKFKQAVSTAFSKIKQFFDPFVQSFKTAFRNVTFGDVLDAGLVANLLMLVRSVTKSFATFSEGVSNFASGFGNFASSIGNLTSSITKTLDSVRGSLEAWQTKIKSDVLMNIAKAVAILAGSLVAIALLVPADSILPALTAVGGLLGEMTIAMIALTKIKVEEGRFEAVNKMALAMSVLAVGLGILVSSMSKLKDVGWEQVGPMLVLVGTGIAALAGSVAILAEIFKGESASLSKDVLIASVSIVLLSSGIQKLAKALATVSVISDSDQLWNSITALGSLFVMLGLFLKESNYKDLQTSATSLTGIAIALYAMIGAVAILNQMPLEEFKDGFIELGVLMAALAAAIFIMGNAKLSGVAISLIALAGAIMMLVDPILTLAAIDSSLLQQGILAITACMGALVVALMLLSKYTGNLQQMLGISAAILSISAGLYILTAALQALVTIPWVTLAGYLVLVLAAFAGFIALSALAAQFTLVITALGDAFFHFGLGIAGIGAGLLMIVTAFNELLILGPGAALGIVGTLGTIIVGVAAIIPTAIASFLGGFELILVALQAVLPGVIKTLGAAVETLLLVVLQIITDCAKPFATAIAEVILAILTTIEEYTPKIIDAIFGIIEAIVDKFTEPGTTQRLVETGKKIITALGKGLWGAVEWLGKKVVEIAPKVLKWLWESFNKLVDKLKEIGGNVINGIITGITEGVSNFFQPIAEVGSTIVDGFKSFFIIESPSQLMRDEVGTQITAGIAEGIEEDTSAEEAAKVKAQGIVNAFKTEIDKINSKGEIYDLEYQLWEKTYEETATDYEKSQKKLENLAYKVRDQIDLVDLATQEYNATLETLGESNEATTEAYKKQLNAQIELSDLYSQLMDEKENMDTLLGKGKRVVNAKLSKKELDEFEEGGVDAGKAEVSGYKSIGPMGYVAATQTADQIIEGILSRKDDTEEAASNVMVDTLQVIKDAHPTWNAEGSGIVVDFAAGIAAAEAEAAEKAKKVSTSSVGGLRTAITDGSAYSAGLETAMQYNKGLEDGQDTNHEKDDMDWAIGDIIGDLFSYDDLHPTITPQYDTGTLEDYAKKAYDVYSKFEDKTNSSLAGGISNSYASKRNDAAAQQSAAQQGYKDIVNALGTTNDLISSYANKLDGMQVVMDNGALVGQVSSGVDKSLGNTASMKKRGAK